MAGGGWLERAWTGNRSSAGSLVLGRTLPRKRDQHEIAQGLRPPDIGRAWLAKLRSHVLGTVTLASWDETTAVPYCARLELCMSSEAEETWRCHEFLRRVMLRPVERFRCSSCCFGPKLLHRAAQSVSSIAPVSVTTNARGYTAGASRIAESLASVSARAKLSWTGHVDRLWVLPS